MCGRVVQKTPMSEIRVLFETVNPVPNAAPTYNGAPTDTLPIVRLDGDGRRSLDLLRWGLVPWWAKDIKMGSRCINAMAETVAAKPAFRDAFARGQRCIMPVDGFYEWQKTTAGKQPHAIVSADGLPLAMAGLWERWKDRASGGHHPDLYHHDNGSQRALRRDSRPHAGDPVAREMGGVAGRA